MFKGFPFNSMCSPALVIRLHFIRRREFDENILVAAAN